MFWIILTAIVTIMHVYFCHHTYTVLKGFFPLKVPIILTIALFVLFILAVIYSHNNTGKLARVIEFLGMNWLAVLFLTTVFFLDADILTGFGFLFTRFVPVIRGTALAAAGILSVVALVQGLRSPVINDYEVRLPDLPVEMDGTVLAVLSDLHLGSLLDDKWLEKRVVQVQKLKPDIILMLGDVFEGHGGSQKKLIPVMRKLSAPLGVWGVLGNHEYYFGHYSDTSMFDESGIRLLRNEWREIKPGLILAGVDNLHYGRSESNKEMIKKSVEGHPHGSVILLSHTPILLDTAADAGVNLMLSGHTHGGQIWPFDYLAGIFHKFIEGRHEINGMTLIISRGTGTWGPRMRLFSRSEILRITLRSGD